MDGRIAASLDRFDEATCSELLSRLAAGDVWQVPTLVQMRGFFFADDPSAEIRNTTSVHAVLRRGRLLDRAALDALIASAQATATAR